MLSFAGIVRRPCLHKLCPYLSAARKHQHMYATLLMTMTPSGQLTDCLLFVWQQRTITVLLLQVCVTFLLFADCLLVRFRLRSNAWNIFYPRIYFLYTLIYIRICMYKKRKLNFTGSQHFLGQFSKFVWMPRNAGHLCHFTL